MKAEDVLIVILIGLVILWVVDFVLLHRRNMEHLRKMDEDMRHVGTFAVMDDWTLLADGSSGDVELEVAWLSAAQRMFILFQKKNHDYGSKNLAMAWTQGVIVRKADKLARLWNLVGIGSEPKEAKVSDEKIADAFLDDANYSLVGFLMEQGKWPRATLDENIGRAALARLLVEIKDKMDDQEQDEFEAYQLAYEIATDLG